MQTQGWSQADSPDHCAEAQEKISPTRSFAVHLLACRFLGSDSGCLTLVILGAQQIVVTDSCLGLQQGERQDVGAAANELPLKIPAEDASAACIACAADDVGVRFGLLVYEVQDILGLRGKDLSRICLGQNPDCQGRACIRLA